MVVVAMSSDGRVSNSEVSPRLCRGTHRGLTYAAVEKDEASYSARYFICIPPFSKGGRGDLGQSCAGQALPNPPFAKGEAEVQPPWAAHGFIGKVIGDRPRYYTACRLAFQQALDQYRCVLADRPAHRPAVSRWGRSPCRSHNGHNGAGCCPLPDLPGYS